MKLRRWITGLAGALLLTAAGCGGGGGIGGTGTATGSMRVWMTDAPACGYDAVNVTVERVRVHSSSSADADGGGWSEIVLDPPRRIDLLGLTNGALEELGTVELPAGTYQQIRLVLAANDGSTPPANSIVRSDTGEEIALTTPSAQQSGIKLKANVEVPEGKVLDVVLDFDACRSVVKRGNSGQYNLKPVIAVIPLLSDPGLRVVGYVDAGIASTSTAVSLQASGVPVKATVPDANGRFVLRPVPAGIYDLVVTAPGRATAVMTGVTVVAAEPTTVSTPTFPIAPAAAASAPVPVSGSVQPADSTVRVLQTLGGGPTVEIGFLPVDAVSGLFSTALTAAAPLRTAYAGPPTAAIVFAADASAAGLYTVEARSAAGAVLTTDVDVNVVPVPPVEFVFP